MVHISEKTYSFLEEEYHVQKAEDLEGNDCESRRRQKNDDVDDDDDDDDGGGGNGEMGCLAMTLAESEPPTHLHSPAS